MICSAGPGVDSSINKFDLSISGSSEDYRGLIEWKRLIRQTTTTGQFIVQSLEEDNHDVPALNRIIFTSDWSLVILNLTAGE
jgi:hypothetical protein